MHFYCDCPKCGAELECFEDEIPYCDCGVSEDELINAWDEARMDWMASCADMEDYFRNS